MKSHINSLLESLRNLATISQASHNLFLKFSSFHMNGYKQQKPAIETHCVLTYIYSFTTPFKMTFPLASYMKDFTLNMYFKNMTPERHL